MTILWISFLICTALIVYSGSRLSIYGDKIGETTGLGGSWIGFVFLAAATSMPELITGASSIILIDAPDLATGAVVGSCCFNLLILALIDIMSPKKSVFGIVGGAHLISAGYGMLLLGGAALGIAIGTSLPAILWIGPYSFLFLGLYIVSMRQMYLFEQNNSEEQPPEPVNNKSLYLRFALHTLVLISAAVYLPKVGAQLAQSTGLGQTFVGNVLIAISTSLPEIVVSVSAIRIGAFDLAVGNILGSNIFNMGILAIDDLIFLKGPILSFTTGAHIIPSITAVMMNAVAIIGFSNARGEKRFPLSSYSVWIIALFTMNIMLLYRMH